VDRKKRETVERERESERTCVYVCAF
jgi:hypothetical protein